MATLAWIVSGGLAVSASRRAITFNVLSASTFLVGGVLAWAVSPRFDNSWLLRFAAGAGPGARRGPDGRSPRRGHARSES